MDRPVYAIERMDLDTSTSYGFQHLGALELLNSFLKDVPKGSFVSCRIPSSHYPQIHALEKSGFLLIETYLILRNQEIKRTKDTGVSKTPVEIRDCTSSEIVRVMEIASSSFVHDRFHSDPNIPDHLAGYSRALWVQSALRDPSKDLLIATRGSEILGFNCTKARAGQVVIDLIGVDHAARGKDVGSQLVNRTFTDALAKGVRSSEVGTQAHNVGSVRFYQKHGFVLTNSFYTFHLHL